MSEGFNDFTAKPTATATMSNAEAAAPRAPQKIRTELRPTLVVGLGGTGHTVLTYLKARYLDSFGPGVLNPKVLRFLSFDTAEESITAESEQHGLVSLEKGREFIWIGGVQIQNLLNSMDRKPFIKEWFPTNFQPRNITQGAQQVRPLGRLALFENYAKIRDTLNQTINELSSARGEGMEAEHFVVPPSTGVNVVIVSSICGGTGSGIFLDMAYILHNICRMMPFYRVNGYLVMPQAFSTVPGEAIQANGFAALRELDYFNEYGNFEVNYPSETIRISMRKPFDICYLIDGVNERAKTLSGLKELGPLISEAIFLQNASQIGQADKSAFDNVKKLGNIDSGRPTAYSSVGTASIYFPAGPIVEICAHRYGRQLISEGLLSNQPDASVVGTQVRNFIGGAGLTAPALLAEMQKAQQGSAMIIQLDATGLPEVGNSEILGQVDTLVTDFEQNRLNGLYRIALEQNRSQLQTKLSERLSQELQRYVDDPKEYGLLFGIDFLEGLRVQLNQLTNFLDQERVSYNSAYEHELPDVHAARNNISNAVSSGLPIGRSGKVKRARADYLEARQRSFGLLFESRTRQQALTLVSNLLSTIGFVQTSLNRLLEHLRSASDNLERKAMQRLQEKGTALPPLITDITTDRDIGLFYTKYARPGRQAVAQLLESTGGFYNWVNQSYGEVEARILRFTREIFQPILQTRITEVINEKRNDQSPEARMDKLLQDALPFWNYDSHRLTGDGTLDTIMVLGDEDSTRSIFEPRSAMSIISTRDPHRVMVLNTKHGLPLFALYQYDSYKERYNNYKRRNVSPLHLFPNIAFNDDSGEKHSWQLFALGEAFGLITPVGLNSYDYVAAEKLDPPTRLGQGLNTALANFGKEEEVQRELKDRLDKLWAREGHTKAEETINKYINSGKPLTSGNNSSIEILRNELRKLARDYLNGKEL